MTREETIKVLAYLRELYPNGKNVSKNTVTVWHDLLEKYEYPLVTTATKEVAQNYTGYTMPPPAEIINQIRLMANNDSAIELWRIAENAIRKGTVLTEEEFKSLPVPVQKYFGGRSAIKDLALLDNSSIPNERARFINNIGIIEAKERVLQVTGKNLSLKQNDTIAEQKA